MGSYGLTEEEAEGTLGLGLRRASCGRGFGADRPVGSALVHLSRRGRKAFRDYKKSMRQVLDDLPE